MVNDSVREELAASIAPIATPMKRPTPETAIPASNTNAVSEAGAIDRRSQTSDLATKKTSPTLAEFKTPNASLPEWRIQLQNSVRQRSGRVELEAASTYVVPKTSAARKPKPDLTDGTEVDQKVANAMKRIEQSRRRYLPTEKAREGIRVAKAAASRAYPFNVVSRSADLPERPAVQRTESVPTPRPKLVPTLKIEKKRYDTNKLVPILEAEYMAEIEPTVQEPAEEIKRLRDNWSQKIEFKSPHVEEEVTAAESALDAEETGPDVDEIDDLAPLSLRFNAGLFDLIIGGFISFVLFSPFIGLSETWASLTGLLLFSAILLVVMFVYLTASVGFLGRTFGMKLFSLDMVDIEQSEFPTLHQAAVSSSIYLLSLLFVGLGFVPLFFNEERRAAHDIVSGTILVRGA